MSDHNRIMTTPFIEAWKGLLISAALLKGALPGHKGRPPSARYLKRPRRALAPA